MTRQSFEWLPPLKVHFIGPPDLPGGEEQESAEEVEGAGEALDQLRAQQDKDASQDECDDDPDKMAKEKCWWQPGGDQRRSWRERDCLHRRLGAGFR